MSQYKVEVRESKDGLFRWLVVDGKGSSVAMGTGGCERAEEAALMGESVVGGGETVQAMKDRLEQHEVARAEMGLELVKAQVARKKCEEYRGTLHERLLAQKEHFKKELASCGRRNQELSEALGKRDVESKKVREALVAKASALEENNIELAHRLEQKEAAMPWYCGWWAMGGGAMGVLAAWWLL